MASVTVLTAAKTLELINETIVNGILDENGHLILEKSDGTTIDLGSISPVASHSALTNLGADDHPQYALADGTRGSFATTAQGTKADNARPNKGGEVSLLGNDQTPVETISITDDATPTSGWINRWGSRFRDSAVSAWRNVTQLNEYGELRVSPAKSNTTGARFFSKELASHPARDMNVPVVELMDDRTTRTSLRGWLGDGTETRRGIKMSDVVVLGLSEAVPANLPANTVIVRKTT